MVRYFSRRLALLPIGALLANFLGFAYAHLVWPIQLANNPMFAVSGEPEPLLPAYWGYFRRIWVGDFGTTPPSGARVTDIVSSAALASITLLALALLVSVLIGVPLGIKAVRSQPVRIAPWLTALSTAGLAMPGFYIGSLLILALLWYLIYGPTSLPLPVQGFGYDLHLVLPVVVLAARPTAQITQVTAGLMAAELEKQHIVTARSIGNPWPRVRRRHAWRNIIAPVAVAVFTAFRLTAGELIIVEWVFAWQGLGRLLALILIAPHGGAFDSPLFLHPPTLGAVLMVLAGLFLAGDLASGAVARSVDPRLREAGHADRVAHEA